MAYRRRSRYTPSRSRSSRRSARNSGRVRMARAPSRGRRSGNTLRIELVQPGMNAVARPFNLSANAPAEKPKGSRF